MADDSVSNVESATETPKALKSTDTSTVKPVIQAVEEAKATPKPEKQAEPAEAKAEDAGDDDAGDVAGEDDDATAADSPDEDKRPKRRESRRVKERLERLRIKTAQETREQVLREVQQQQATQQYAQANAQAPEQRKTLADFNFDEAAYDDYRDQRTLQRFEQQQRQRESERQQSEAVEQFKTKVDSFEERVGAGGWEDILSAQINTDPAFKPLTDLFMGDDNDLDIALHFAKHPAEARRINALPRLQQVREVAKLAEQFAGEEAPEAKATVTPLPKKTTNAPPPPKTVSGSGKPSVDINSPELSTEDRIRLWRKTK